MKEAESEVSSQLQPVKRRSANFVNRTGLVYGKLTVLREAPAGKWSNARWECECACGQLRTVSSQNLQSGSNISCGCHRRELTIQRSTTHGHSGSILQYNRHPLYKTWDGIKQRCHNPSDPAYDRYGGRGIEVCERWRNDFMAFITDMGEKPSPAHSIERKDNNLGYSKENCIWATRVEQCNNRRSNVHITHDGRTQTIAQWARECVLQPQTIIWRIRAGWSVVDALTKKAARRNASPLIVELP